MSDILSAIEERARTAKARAERATEGPWEAIGLRITAPCPGKWNEGLFDSIHRFHKHMSADITFVERAREDVPTLADDVLKLSTVVRKLWLSTIGATCRCPWTFKEGETAHAQEQCARCRALDECEALLKKEKP